MPPRVRNWLLAPALASICTLAPSCSAQAIHNDIMISLQDGLLHPPADARPMVRWWWFGAAVTKPEILRELQQMQADGIGGVELAFVYPQELDDPPRGIRNLPFLSPAMLDAVNYARAEGRRLGLRIDLTLCSGWPYGGPDTSLGDAATRLRIGELPVPANANSLVLPTLAAGESFISASIMQGAPKHWAATSATPLLLPTGNEVKEVTISHSPETRVAVFFIASHTRQQVKRAAVGAEGYVLDPYSHEAVANHLKKVGEPLVNAFEATPPYAIFSDSLEAYGADWTPTLPAEFRKRRGYDLIPHLPELLAGGTASAQKVRHDYGRTLTELVDENYLTQINEWAKTHGTRFRSQTYGEPAVSLASQRLVSLPEGEGLQWRAFSTLRWATSANHLFGNNVTSGETYTWLHSPVFRATPLDMKAEADIDFIMGENQLIFHGWPYSPPQMGEPGWSLYAAAVFNDHNPWHPVMPSVTTYIARMSWLLRQGEPANQVALLLPTDDAWASFEPGKVTVTGAMQKLISPTLMSSILSAGYNVDFIDADTINRLGIHHEILVLPPTDRIPLATLKKIAAFQAQGGKVIAVGRAPSMDEEGNGAAELSALSAKLFRKTSRTFVADPVDLSKALPLAVQPDFHVDSADNSTRNKLGFIRRKLRDGDVYFVVNTSNQPVAATVRFATHYPSGEAIDPDSGIDSPINAASVRLHLAPYESRVFLFGAAERRDQTQAIRQTDFAVGELASVERADLSEGWNVIFTGIGKSVAEEKLADWTADTSTLHYSGEGVYSRDFTLSSNLGGAMFLEVNGGSPVPGDPAGQMPEHAVGSADDRTNPLVTRTGPGMRAYFDPPIREAALVKINGKAAGSLWHPPYRLDVTSLLKPGRNSIEIHVFNTALNAWSAQPPHDYSPLKAKYGDRFQMQDLDKVKPIPSGILGTIHIVSTEPSK
jgi:hypothetical protein